jgi:hypothetical protein
LIKNSGTLYTRIGTGESNKLRVRNLEQTLNHIFDITFAIASDAVTARLLFHPLGIDDTGPIESLGREVAARFGWGDANVTQQDGFFVTPKSVVGVELKLGAVTSPIQVLKYLAMMVLEEMQTGEKQHLGLLYVTPDDAPNGVFKQCGADASGAMSARFWEALPDAKINSVLRNLLTSHADRFEHAGSRLVIAHRSWKDLAEEGALIRHELTGGSPGEETLSRLLEGFIAAVVEHGGTGVSSVSAGNGHDGHRTDTKPR